MATMAKLPGIFV